MMIILLIQVKKGFAMKLSKLSALCSGIVACSLMLAGNSALSANEPTTTENTAISSSLSFKDLLNTFIVGINDAKKEDIKKSLSSLGLKVVCFKTRIEDPEYLDGSKFSEYADIIYGNNLSIDCHKNLSSEDVTLSSNSVAAYMLNTNVIRRDNNKKIYLYNDAVFYIKGKFQTVINDIKSEPGFVGIDDDGRYIIQKEDNFVWVTLKPYKNGFLYILFDREH